MAIEKGTQKATLASPSAVCFSVACSDPDIAATSAVLSAKLIGTVKNRATYIVMV
jgi:hypothetical protein